MGQLFQLVIAGGRIGKFDQFHLVKLVLTDQAAGIASGGTGFSAEAGGIGAIFQRQIAAGKNLIAMQVGHGHFGGGDQEILQPLQLEHILFKLGQLTGAGHGSAVGDKGRLNLYIAVGSVRIKKIVDDSALQTCAEITIKVETLAGHLGSALGIQDI
ncbi:hypothetical protein SDC9_186576 [bioreactor metagenome]|uniref:Uncharacterized protein n=1 Tax=bioreactor metagenome TaxID=1076179 RepID=A0A645HJX5_9ZZZZ